MTQHKPMVVIEDRVMVPHAALDHDGYRDWVKSDEYADYPASLRTTFVVGEVLVEMTPESIERHNQVRTALTVALGVFVRDNDIGTIYSDGVLVTNEPAGLSCEPDFTFVSWQTFEQGRVRLVERATGSDFIEILGSPDLVVEVVSDSSVRKDTRLVRDAYFRADILEYWLIDARGADIRFEILVRGDAGFVARADLGGPQDSDVFGGRWSLTRFRNRVGQFAYQLHRTA